MEQAQLMCLLEQVDDLMNPDRTDQIDGVPIDLAISIIHDAMRA